ncbi:MAG: biotin--[acetyl-CoA-carboxylase] ligase [Bacteroidales bacterium]|nr:biotin--[acetyl-CoA-carboxylase] ligase [Bacteroidales bacterium]MDD4216120.1 biotin--[acetyl-CoA-carboxylase] ligase [Bacteroidales bacterium]MDY0142457.1 biotin--[acetyl-CoA-carboxylase] ligase [Bacteroidales bacterium]
MKFIKRNIITSTNIFVSELLTNNKLSDETVVYTNFQTNGRGFAQNKWYSEENKNLLFSIIIFPEMNVEGHFCLNMIISLAICDYLLLKGVKAKIKWPNDIYVKDSKIAGILVENCFYGDIIKSSIIGVGLNLNQIFFPKEIPNPVSLKNLTNTDYNIDKEIREISNIISDKIKKYKSLEFSEIRIKYLENLYRLNVDSLFKKSNEIFTAKIIDIRKTGHLVICDKNNKLQEFYFKEIEFKKEVF